MFRPDYGSSSHRNKKTKQINKKYALQRIRLPVIRYHKKVSLYDHKDKVDELSLQYDDIKFQE